MNQEKLANAKIALIQIYRASAAVLEDPKSSGPDHALVDGLYERLDAIADALGVTDEEIG